jgi:2-phosphosulfolactate phosphatase
VSDKRVSIRCFEAGFQKHVENHALVAIDVIRATTTALTAIALGYRCHVAPTLESAWDTASKLTSAVLVGECGGEMPNGFDITNSPCQIEDLSQTGRPIVLLSSAGSRLMHAISYTQSAYVACFRNYTATIRHLAENHAGVVLVGAGTRGEFREEDQMCCAWIAHGLIQRGFVSEDPLTEQLVGRWRNAGRLGFLMSNSVEYLRRTSQVRDLKFILNHFDDLDFICTVRPDASTSSAIAAKGMSYELR